MSPVNMDRRLRLLIIGNRGGTNVGGSFEEASRGITDTELIEFRHAMSGPRLLHAFSWHLMGKRPPKLRTFGREVLAHCKKYRPDMLLATGISALDSATLQQIGQLGARRILFVTDDPWNPAHYAPWFLKTLPHYDQIFSTKRAIMAELRTASRAEVSYLPFAYDPRIFYPPRKGEEACESLSSDVMFAGGADSDRVPHIYAFIQAGFRLALFGSYWERFSETRAFTQGQADPETVRKAIVCAKVAICLVRRANRDGHAMRTFEIPACGSCMLTEWTEEHHEIFGAEGHTVLYFRTIPEMIEKTRWLLEHPEERQRLAAAAHQLITNGGNTYRDRLMTILDFYQKNIYRQPASLQTHSL